VILFPCPPKKKGLAVCLEGLTVSPLKKESDKINAYHDFRADAT